MHAESTGTGLGLTGGEHARDPALRTRLAHAPAVPHHARAHRRTQCACQVVDRQHSARRETQWQRLVALTMGVASLAVMRPSGQLADPRSSPAVDTLKLSPGIPNILARGHPRLRPRRRLATLAAHVVRGGQEPTQSMDAIFAPLRARVAELVAQGRMHGCSYAVALGGRVVATEAVGTTPSVMGEGGMLPPETPVDTGTIFITASVTKPLVAIACMQLVEAGRLALDIPVTALIPEFVGGEKASVTVRHLLTHTGGIPDGAAGIDRTAHPTLADHTRKICAMPLLFRPGTHVSYSSAAFHLLAVIVEAVSGQPLSEYLRDAVFLPLGMRDTTLGLSADRQVGRESAMNREIPTGMNGEQLHPNKDSLAIAREVAAAGIGGYSQYGHNSTYWRTLGAAWAGLLTTASDLSHLYQVLVSGGQLGDGPRILRATTVREMLQCHTRGLADFVQSQEGVVQQDSLIDGSAPSSQWGLGFRLNRGIKKFGEVGAERTFGHHGGVRQPHQNFFAPETQAPLT